MKPRTAEELVDFLDCSSQKRKRELVTINASVQHGGLHEVPFASRGAIVFSYAHWEGFVKDAAQAYVEYVNMVGPPVSVLIPNFQALASKTRILVAGAATKRIAPHIDVVQLFTNDFARRVNIDAEKAIDTESNLSWDVFHNICQCLGIDATVRWSTYSPFMDDLFKTRCAIAHGGLDSVSVPYAKEAIRTTIHFLEWFKADVSNAAIQELFKTAYRPSVVT